MTQPDFREHVLATFSQFREARAAAGALKDEFPDHRSRIGHKDDALDALSLGQETEIDQSLAVVGIGLMSGPNTRGALIWGALGAIIGALLLLPLTWLVDIEGTSLWVVAVAFIAIGALALSSATFILGAGRQAVKEGETTPEDPT